MARSSHELAPWSAPQQKAHAAGVKKTGAGGTRKRGAKRTATPAGHAAASPRGRPKADLSEQVRAWFWLAVVRHRDPTKGFDELDHVILKDAVRPRALRRIAREGHSPDRLHPKRGFSLVDRFDSTAPWHGTASVYRSAFWALIGPRLLDREALETLGARVVNSLDVSLPDVRPLFGSRHGQIALPYLRSVSPRVIVDRLHAVAPAQSAHDPARSLDFLALLAVVFRLAIAEMDLEMAVELRPYLRW